MNDTAHSQDRASLQPKSQPGNFPDIAHSSQSLGIPGLNTHNPDTQQGSSFSGSPSKAGPSGSQSQTGPSGTLPQNNNNVNQFSGFSAPGNQGQNNQFDNPQLGGQRGNSAGIAGPSNTGFNQNSVQRQNPAASQATSVQPQSSVSYEQGEFMPVNIWSKERVFHCQTLPSKL